MSVIFVETVTDMGENGVESVEAGLRGGEGEIGERERGDGEGVGGAYFEPGEELVGLGFGKRGLGLGMGELLALEEVPRVFSRLRLRLLGGGGFQEGLSFCDGRCAVCFRSFSLFFRHLHCSVASVRETTPLQCLGGTSFQNAERSFEF